MLHEAINIGRFLDIVLKLKKAFGGLKSSRLLLKETDLFDLVEKYFSLEPLPQGRVILKGLLSNYSLSNNLPVYSPHHFKSVKENKTPFFNEAEKRIEDRLELNLEMAALSVPSIVHNPIELDDKSVAKILWLYPEDIKGLVCDAEENVPLASESLTEIFRIKLENKPIPILVDKNLSNQFLYKRVKITGIVTTAAIEYFEQLKTNCDPFILDYYSNCFRPLSAQDGILAIDARKQTGRIDILSNERNEFKVLYTVQGLISVPDNKIDSIDKDILMRDCIDVIPYRQGMGPLRSFGYSGETIHSIISLGKVKWQQRNSDLSISAFKEVNVNSPSYGQADLSELTHNWQAWQKAALAMIRRRYNFEAKIHPLLCSNKIHESSFHVNGLQISKRLESLLFSHNPAIRQSIDWLGVSTGKV